MLEGVRIDVSLCWSSLLRLYLLRWRILTLVCESLMVFCTSSRLFNSPTNLASRVHAYSALSAQLLRPRLLAVPRCLSLSSSASVPLAVAAAFAQLQLPYPPRTRHSVFNPCNPTNPSPRCLPTDAYSRCGAVAIFIFALPQLPPHILYLLMRQAQTGSWTDSLCCCPTDFPWVVVVRWFRP